MHGHDLLLVSFRALSGWRSNELFIAWYRSPNRYSATAGRADESG